MTIRHLDFKLEVELEVEVRLRLGNEREEDRMMSFRSQIAKRGTR